MNEEVLRTMIREAVARQLAGTPSRPEPPFAAPVTCLTHASHYRYTLPESGGPCLIEPTVGCNHCGYCESHGH